MIRTLVRRRERVGRRRRVNSRYRRRGGLEGDCGSKREKERK